MKKIQDNKSVAKCGEKKWKKVSFFVYGAHWITFEFGRYYDIRYMLLIKSKHQRANPAMKWQSNLFKREFISTFQQE